MKESEAWPDWARRLGACPVPPACLETHCPGEPAMGAAWQGSAELPWGQVLELGQLAYGPAKGKVLADILNCLLWEKLGSVLGQRFRPRWLRQHPKREPMDGKAGVFAEQSGTPSPRPWWAAQGLLRGPVKAWAKMPIGVSAEDPVRTKFEVGGSPLRPLSRSLPTNCCKPSGNRRPKTRTKIHGHCIATGDQQYHRLQGWNRRVAVLCGNYK